MNFVLRPNTIHATRSSVIRNIQETGDINYIITFLWGRNIKYWNIYYKGFKFKGKTSNLIVLKDRLECFQFTVNCLDSFHDWCRKEWLKRIKSGRYDKLIKFNYEPFSDFIKKI